MPVLTRISHIYGTTPLPLNTYFASGMSLAIKGFRCCQEEAIFPINTREVREETKIQRQASRGEFLFCCCSEEQKQFFRFFYNSLAPFKEKRRRQKLLIDQAKESLLT